MGVTVTGAAFGKPAAVRTPNALTRGNRFPAFPDCRRQTMATPDEMYDEANALKDQGDLEGAVVSLRKILEIDPNHVLTHAALAVHLQKLGQDDESITHSLRVTELEPDDAFSFTQLSVVYMRCGRVPEAEDAMARARNIQMSAGG